MSRFLDALHSGRVLLMDGAMGTELQRAGIQPGECYEQWNLTHPERVQAIHQAYVDAGADVLLTNTFQANPVALERHGAADQLVALQRAAVSLAKLAAGAARFVIADVGPIMGAPGEPEFADRAMIRRTVGAVSDVQAILFETCSSPRVRWAVRHADPYQQGPPILLSLAYQRSPGGKLLTHSGHAPEWFARRARAYGIAALGVNCGRDIGLDEVIEIIRRYRRETDLPLFARPNAGTPVRDGDRWIYPLSPEMMAARLPELLAAGVAMVGGCCGTTPDHIAEFRRVIDDWNCHPVPR